MRFDNGKELFRKRNSRFLSFLLCCAEENMYLQSQKNPLHLNEWANLDIAKKNKKTLYREQLNDYD